MTDHPRFPKRLSRLKHLDIIWPRLQQLVGTGQMKIVNVVEIENLPGTGTKHLSMWSALFWQQSQTDCLRPMMHLRKFLCFCMFCFWFSPLFFHKLSPQTVLRHATVRSCDVYKQSECELRAQLLNARQSRRTAALFFLQDGGRDDANNVLGSTERHLSRAENSRTSVCRNSPAPRACWDVLRQSSRNASQPELLASVSGSPRRGKVSIGAEPSQRPTTWQHSVF